ncbi:MAG TPA: long-chain-fatty-acid--CoA ligase [Gammaproteobacteria bacterium]|nr:long-chain-fatty-acid--CoA ligase [Gammaproteobacteria bacterium]
MRGQMMTLPLTINEIMYYAARNHGDAQVVSITADEGLHRSTYAKVFERAAQLANALAALGIEQGDRVATLAWNDHRHLELYYGVSCAGYVLHTVNPRLFAEHLLYIINHAEDRVLFFDPIFAPLVAELADRLPTVESFVALCGPGAMPDVELRGRACYETLLGSEPVSYAWPQLDETSASALCYTSGTTGHPKGVLYSHRSTVLHAYGSVMPDAMGLSKRDAIMPVVPMFHANAWGIPYACPLAGAKLVMPGPKMADGETLHALVSGEGVTCALGVPTVWLALLKYLRESGKTVPSLNRTIVGGAACPLSIMKEFEEKHGVITRHAWGMTETSPLGTVNTPLPGMESLPQRERDEIRIKQGRVPFGMDLKIVDDDGAEVPWDGRAFGTLKVRGFWVCDGYFKQGDNVLDNDGWFATGDVASIDPAGFMKITDRTKDVIKSGGEWISSIELENLAMGHPDVAEAAVIGVEHPKWTERPLLVIVPRESREIDKPEILGWFNGKVADWWIPDDVLVTDSIPHTATGKVSKLTLREQLRDYRFPD